MGFRVDEALSAIIHFKSLCREYYRAAAARAGGELLATLRRCETEEGETIERCRALLGQDPPALESSRLEGLLAYEFFRQHLAGGAVSVPDDETGMLDKAIQLEKDSLLLFTELWSGCDDAARQAELMALIHVQKKHLLDLLAARRGA